MSRFTAKPLPANLLVNFPPSRSGGVNRPSVSGPCEQALTIRLQNAGPASCSPNARARALRHSSPLRGWSVQQIDNASRHVPPSQPCIAAADLAARGAGRGAALACRRRAHLLPPVRGVHVGVPPGRRAQRAGHTASRGCARCDACRVSGCRNGLGSAGRSALANIRA